MSNSNSISIKYNTSIEVVTDWNYHNLVIINQDSNVVTFILKHSSINSPFYEELN